MSYRPDVLLTENNLSDVPTKGTGRFNLRIPSIANAQCASTANVNIASPGASVDGFSFAASGLDSVLLTAQSTPSQNGPWTWNGASSPLTRPTDFASGATITTGRIIAINNGTVNGNSLWVLPVASSGITIDTSSQTWTALSITGSTANEAIIRANPLNQFATATGDYSMGTHRLRALQSGILSTDAVNAGQLANGQRAYVVSGCVWTGDSLGGSRNASMTSGTVMIAGILLTVAAVTARTFTASSDTYVDATDNGDGTALLTYTAVTNNSLSPALAASGTLLNTVRLAVLTVGASNIAATTNIGQGSPLGVTVGSASGSSTVAVGSNNANITATPLNVASGASFSTGGGWCAVAHSGGQTYTIQYTGVSANTLTGVTVIAGSGTVSTGDTVTQMFGSASTEARPVGVTDMLGNPIYPTRPYPGLVGYVSFVNVYTTTQTSAAPIPFLIAPFVIPPGPSRQVKLTIGANFVGSSAAAGTTITTSMFIGNAVSGGTSTNVASNKVAVASDGNNLSLVGLSVAQQAPGSYTAQAASQQGAAGTFTLGASLNLTFLAVELV